MLKQDFEQEINVNVYCDWIELKFGKTPHKWMRTYYWGPKFNEVLGKTIRAIIYK